MIRICYRLRLPLVVLSLLLAACSSNSHRPSFYLLTAQAEAPATKLSTTIGVGPVRIAPFLDTTRIVVHGGNGLIQASDSHRWSEPLDEAVQRVMLQNLATLTEAKLRNFPWRQRAAPAWAIRLDILDLDRLSDGHAQLDVIWQLEDMQAERLVRSRRERFRVPVSGSSFDALPAAYSALLEQLAQRLTTALRDEIDGAVTPVAAGAGGDR